MNVALNDEAANALSQSAFLCLLLLTVLLGYAIRVTGFKYATEGSVALLLGATAGGVIVLYYLLLDPLHRVPRRLVTFDEDMFFNTLLPPIIFSAGFSVKKKLFFANFLTLLLFGVGGTMLTAGALAATARGIMGALGLPRRGLLRNSLALGAVLACTDSVAALGVVDKEASPQLYSLLFGEGVVNDATAIVLLGATMAMPSGPGGDDPFSLSAALSLLLRVAWLFSASTALGLGFGLASAAIVRWLFRRPAPDREVLTVGLLGLAAYSAAGAARLSPILSVFFCAIAMSHYTWHNLSPAAKVITRHGFHTVSVLCEGVLFVYAGLDMWITAPWWRSDSPRRPGQSPAAILALTSGLLAAMLAARAALTFPLCALADRAWRRPGERLGARGAGALWWGGLPRGAITLALAYHCFIADADVRAERRLIIASCVGVVALTTMGFGAVTHTVMGLLLGPPPCTGRRRTNRC